MPTTESTPAADDSARKLLEIVAGLAAELKPGAAAARRVELDSALDRDLGFDSLTRVELVMRIERGFGVHLPEHLLGAAESPRDLLRAVQSAPTAADIRQERVTPQVPVDETQGSPDTARTLVEVLEWHVQTHPDRTHVFLYETAAEDPVDISYRELYDGARGLAAGLQDRGLARGQAVAIMLPTGREYLYTFMAVLMAGGVPVPIYPPARPSQLEDHLRRHVGILSNAGTAILVTVEEARTVARLLLGQVDALEHVATCDELASNQPCQAVAAEPGDIAFLQYTSGSTGAPKGVVLTHSDLLANIRAMGRTVEVTSADVFVSWLPLYHDMGLIGAWLGSLYYAMSLVLMSPLAFLSRPSRWLWTIHRHRGTLSAAPNFAYELCLSKLTDEDLEGLDLSSWRMAFNGAEQVSPHTVERFNERFAAYGLSPNAMSPVYGLAEAAVGLAFPPLDRGALIDRVDREALLSSGEARPAAEPGPDTLEFVSCGQPLPGYQIRVVADGRELPERREGRVQFQGPSATSGYYRNPEASRNLYDGDWLDTGDLGYMAAGELYLTSRTKDLIIRGGRNIYPYEVEEAIGELEGIRKGCVAMFGGVDPASGTERVVVVAETRETDQGTLDQLRQAGMEVATGLIGMPPDEIILAPPQTVLKTSSGKIRRSAVRELYERDAIGRGPRSVWWQVTRMALASVPHRWRRARRRFGELAYATWVHGLFWLLVPPVFLAVVLLPGAGLRWSVMRGGARLLLWLAAIPTETRGFDRLPADEAAVLVANHSSYLDSLVLVAILPEPVTFIAKGELREQFLARLFLERIGARMVERFDWRQGAQDAHAVAADLRDGRSLLFYPEGTLTRAPGLLPFHMGAFIAAADTGAPVNTLVIRGTRSILRDGSWFPHRGPISVTVGEALRPAGEGWEAAVALRNAAREDMLARLGEPDLAAETPGPVKPPEGNPETSKGDER